MYVMELETNYCAKCAGLVDRETAGVIKKIRRQK
jgi:hypothetical protein